MIDPTARDAAADDRAWFHRHIDPVVEAEPVADAWAAIEARVHGDVPSPTARRSPRTRWLVAAAVIAVVAAAAVVLAATDRRDHDTVTTGQSGDTGLYIPESLPQGWSLRAAWVSKPPTSCAAYSRVWQGRTNGAVTPRLELAYTPCDLSASAPPADPGPALGNGIDRSEIIEQLDTGVRLIRWNDRGNWTLRSEGGLGTDRLVEAAKAIVAAPASAAAPLPGMGLTGAHLGQSVPSGRTLNVSLRAPSGDTVSYRLNLAGEGPDATPFSVDDPRDVEGQALPVALRDQDGSGLGEDQTPLDECCRRGTAYVGTWPGADLEVPRTDLARDPGQPRPDESAANAANAQLLDVIAHLRPATADEWQAFAVAAEKPVSRRVASATTLAEALSTAPLTRTTATTTTKPAPATSGSTTATPTSLPPSGAHDPVLSDPGTAIPAAERNDGVRSLAGLDVRLELASSVIPATPAVPGTLVLRNPTDQPIVINECAQLQARWGLTPAGAPDTELPGQDYIDCYDTEIVRIDPGQTVRHPIDWWYPKPFTALVLDRIGWTRGTLPAGDYLAVVAIPGRDETIRVQVPVTVPEPPCRTSDEDLSRYVGETLSRAESRARSTGDSVRVLSRDDTGEVDFGDVQCRRLNVTVMNDVDGTISSVLRY